MNKWAKVTLMLALLVIGIGAISGCGVKALNTPEEAVASFIQGLNSGDRELFLSSICEKQKEALAAEGLTEDEIWTTMSEKVRGKTPIGLQIEEVDRKPDIPEALSEHYGRNIVLIRVTCKASGTEYEFYEEFYCVLEGNLWRVFLV